MVIRYTRTGDCVLISNMQGFSIVVRRSKAFICSAPFPCVRAGGGKGLPAIVWERGQNLGVGASKP
jgi:hypothetical protein